MASVVVLVDGSAAPSGWGAAAVSRDMQTTYVTGGAERHDCSTVEAIALIVGLYLVIQMQRRDNNAANKEIIIIDRISILSNILFEIVKTIGTRARNADYRAWVHCEEVMAAQSGP